MLYYEYDSRKLNREIVTMYELTQQSKLAGEVLIDGHNIKDLDLKFVRRNVAAVSQEPSLFSGTIKDNLKVGNLNAEDEQLILAASTANAHSFISQLPKQYETEVRFLEMPR